MVFKNIMAKLQQIVRQNGSTVSSVNLPLEIVSEMGWKKGQKLEITLCLGPEGKEVTIRRELDGSD